MATTDTVLGTIKQGQPAIFFGRARNLQGNLVTQASLSALKYTIVDLVTGLTTVSKASLSIPACIFDTLQIDARWTRDAIGYNALFLLPFSSFPNYASSAQEYLVEFLFYPQDQNNFSAEFRGRVKRINSIL